MISLVKPHIDSSDLGQMQRALKRGAISQGDLTTTLERRFTRLLGTAGSVATNSCTAALVLALKTLGVGHGDEVVIPSYTCLAVAHAVAQVGASPRLADNAYNVEAMDYNMTAQTVRAALSKHTRAVIVPHMFGVPARIDEIRELGLPVVEDITLSLGAFFRGVPIGRWGDICVCSLHSSKMVSTGEGGMLSSRRHGLYKKARYLNGWEDEQVADRLENVFRPYELRYNFHMPDILAALGLSQLKKLKAFVFRRRALARLYTERLSFLPRIHLPRVDESNVFFRYLTALPSGSPPKAIVKFATAGIEAGRGVYPPLHRVFGLSDRKFPNASLAARTLISIPIYPALTDREVTRILKTCSSVFSTI